MRKFAIVSIGLAIVLGFAVGVGGSIQAHEEDEVSITGVADQACLGVGATTWSVTWTITNDPEANPFGILHSGAVETSDPGVTIDLQSQLQNDDSPGRFLPAGDSASASSSHGAGVASVFLTVDHDVSNGPGNEDNTVQVINSEPVDRPPACAPETGSITLVKDTDPTTNDVCFTFDFDPGADIACLEDDDDPIVRSGLAPGEYRIIEGVILGWFLEDIDCDGDPNADEDEGDRTAIIDLDAGEDVTCTFHNERVVVAPTAVPATPVTITLIDVCLNISGAQSSAPAGNIIQNGNCVAPVPAQVAPVARIAPPSTGDAGLK